MPVDQPVGVIKIIVTQVGNIYDISSTDVPGLFLSGYDLEKLCTSIIPAIKILFKRNKGLDVEVMPATSGDVFPEPVKCIPENYIMYQAA